MRHAIVAIEDRRFWEHDGIDLRGIGRALIADIKHQEVVEGGSTITQQFVKNGLERDQKTIARKVREAAFAWQLERSKAWPKKRILTEYLNTIYFGNGAYGVQQAALTYFHHGARDLTIPEAALLAGIPADPSRYDPVTNPQAALMRRELVLKAMLDESMITRVSSTRTRTRPSFRRPTTCGSPAPKGPAQHFVNYVKQQLIDEYGVGRGLRRRAEGADHDRPRAPAEGARRDLEVADETRRPVRRPRRDRSAQRRGEGDGRRQQLPQEPVQPRRAGRPPAGLLVQAVRARDRAARGNLSCDALRVEAADDQPRRQVLGRRQLRRLLSRLDRPRARDDRVRQRRLRAAHAARRLEARRRDRQAHGDPEQARRLLRDRARRRGGEPARARSRLRHARLRRPPRRRSDVRQQAARDREGHRARPDAIQRADEVRCAHRDGGGDR